MTDISESVRSFVGQPLREGRETMVPPQEPTILETSITAAAALAVGGYLVARDHPESSVAKVVDIPLRIAGVGILAIGAAAGSKVILEGLRALPQIGTAA